MSTADGEFRPFRLFIVSFGKPVFVHDRQLAVNLPPVPDCHAPFFRSFKGAQIQGFQKSLGTGENASLTIQLAVCGVQTLDRVCRVDDGSHICGKLEDRSDDIPVAFPAFHGVRIFLRPLLCDPVSVGAPLFLVGSIIDRFKVIGEGLAVFV